MTKPNSIKFWAMILLLFCAGMSAYGQFDRATITGTITDSSGAVIPDVKVLVTRTDTGTNFPGSTNTNGIYTIPGLPVGTYTLKISQSGFKDYVQTGIILVATQILQDNIRMAVGSATETVNITGVAPLLETVTSDVSTTLEASQIRDLPLSAQNGFDAVNLMLNVVPTFTGAQAAVGTQDFVHLAGAQTQSNQVFVDGVEATAGNQGNIPTPGVEALQEMQVSTPSSGAETGASGGAELFELKSGTNQFHGSAFYFMQQEGLNANGWENNFFLSQCASADASCIKTYRRPDYRLADYGGSAGGPIWKKHTFVFGDYEHYNQTNWAINPTGMTVPTAQMLKGDFSQLLTGGAKQGMILNANGSPWINACTGEAYQYGQIFDPQTQKVVNGQTCATPFPKNIIPQGRLSAASQKVAAIYAQYYTPTITNTIYNNFPTTIATSPTNTKRTFDLKVDHYFSDSHRLSASYDSVNWESLGWNGGIQYGKNASPLSSYFSNKQPNSMIRIIDSYIFTPNLVNTAAIGFSRQPTVQSSQNKANPSDFGISNPGNNKLFPQLSFGPGSNGIGYPNAGSLVNAYFTYNAFHYQDTLSWQKGKHSLQFGGTLMSQAMNSGFGLNQQAYNFASDTGGPIDPSLTPFVGNSFANLMLGNVQSANENVTQSAYPRQKTFALFAVDNIKASSKLTLNLALRWDVTLPGHEAAGRWSNFDIHAKNPNWAPYDGAWAFSKNSSTTFETQNNLHQFGPHLGAAYQLTDRLVFRASYGVFYVPLSAFSSGYSSIFPANQTAMAFGVDRVDNTVEGKAAFNWDTGYPGIAVVPPQNVSATSLGTANYPMYIHPHFLYLGHTQNFNIGAEYAITQNLILSANYMGAKGGNLHDPGRSLYQNYPSFSTYQPVLLAGNIFAQINSPGDAAKAGVPYPYPGFSGPAYAAIAPYPQVASRGATVESFGDPAANDSSSFNAFIVEAKARNFHGLNFDQSFTISKWTGGSAFSYNFGNNWGQFAQNLDDWRDANHWIQLGDQKYVEKGYLMYEVPTWKSRQWLQNSKVVDNIIGGWEFGLTNQYGSGTPIAWVYSSYQLPYFFGGDRANFANGANRYNIKNHLNRHLLNPANPMAETNNDFDTKDFAPTSAAAPFGNTPFGFNHWRWNPGNWYENISVMKHVRFGKEDRFSATLRADFFNAFNRHYMNAPDTNMLSPTFGQVTGATGNRVGQLGARVQW